ncbi:sulfotransferase family protein [Alphaproteobacteria bacterium]|nr:sulfotransferase family protein [Alphaproteobacteria bacterium]
MKTLLKKSIAILDSVLLPDATGLEDSKKLYCFFHVQKCGGTAINHFLYQLVYSEQNLIGIDTNDISNIKYESGKVAYRSFINQKIKNRYITNGLNVFTRNPYLFLLKKADYLHGHYLPNDLFDFSCTKFTVIRDPVERLVSKYKMDYGLYKKNKLEHYGRQNISKYVNDPADYFSFLKENNAKEFFGILATFSENLLLDEGIKNILKMDYVFKQTTLESDFKLFLKNEKIKFENPFHNLTIAKHHSQYASSFPLINDKIIDKLRTLLDCEYELVKKVS